MSPENKSYTPDESQPVPDAVPEKVLPPRETDALAHPGLPVKGYKPQQPAENVEAVNRLKVHEELLLREIESIEHLPGIDRRCMAIARTQVQTAVMWAARGVFQPGRLTDEELTDAYEDSTL